MNLQHESTLAEIDRLAGLYMGDVGRKNHENMRAFAQAVILQDRRDTLWHLQRDGFEVDSTLEKIWPEFPWTR